MFLGALPLDLAVSGAQVAWRAIGPGGVTQGAIVRVQLRTDSDLLLTIVAETVSLVPGSLVLDLDREERLIAVHLLHVADLADVERQKARRAGDGGARRAGLRLGRGHRAPSTARPPTAGGTDAVTVVVVASRYALLGGGALLALVRLARGPSLLDRVVATDILLVIISAGLAVYAALGRDPTVVPVLVVVSLLAFVGSVSVARYVGGMLLQSGDGRRTTPGPRGGRDGERAIRSSVADVVAVGCCWPARSCA